MKVKHGDCWISLAAKTGIPLDILQQKNVRITQTRDNPGILYPGDDIKIPELNSQPVDISTEQKHSFKLKAVCL